MKNFWKEPQEKKINKKKIIITSIATILMISVIIIGIIYAKNKNARNWIDRNILRKEISQNNLQIIELNESGNAKIVAFNKYIGVLKENIFDIYNNAGSKEESLTLQITKPIFNSNNRHLAVAEEKGQKIYLITDKSIAWEKKVEGNIQQIEVNKNGYVAVTIVDTSYKTVIDMFDNQGNELFKTFLSTTRVLSTSISNDNKYLALAELDTSGTVIKSNIKMYSIEDGKNNADEALKHVYNGEDNELITKIKFQEKNRLICMYNDKITEIKTDGTIETLTENGNKKVSFIAVELANSVITVEEKSSGLFTADSALNIINTETKKNSTYMAESVTKEIYTSNNIIALNLGAQVEFINTSGWLIKRYTAEQEITNIVLANDIAGIVYRDKIEIINL